MATTKISAPSSPSTTSTPKTDGKMLDKAPTAPGSTPDAAVGGGGDVQLPHERDQSTSPDSTGGMGTGAAGDDQREVMGQAHDDLQEGQVDTDMRATPGLDAQRRDQMVPDSKKPDAPAGGVKGKP